MRSGDRGIALLEVLAALVILAVAGLSMVSLVAQSTDSLGVATAREAEQSDESRLLAAESLLNRSDLDLRIGTHQVGTYFVSVARPERTLYRIAVGRQDTGDVEDLVTVVFRGVPQ